MLSDEVIGLREELKESRNTDQQLQEKPEDRIKEWEKKKKKELWRMGIKKNAPPVQTQGDFRKSILCTNSHRSVQILRYG